MTLSELLAFARQRLDDKAEPYRWDDDTLVLFINEAEREACRRSHLIIDSTTPAVCRAQIKAGNPNVTLSPFILAVRDAYLGPYVAGELSWNSITNSLLNSADTFLTSGFEVGDQVEVKGFTGATNNGIFTIASVVAGTIVVEETGTMTTETATAVTVETQRKQLVKKTSFELDETMPGWNLYEGEPTVFVVDENGAMQLVGLPDKANTLHLTVSRLPLTDMALTGTTPRTTPDINAMYHYDLIDWVCHLAKLTDDQDSVDYKTADLYDRKFTGKFGPRPSGRAEQFKKRYPRETRVRPRAFGS